MLSQGRCDDAGTSSCRWMKPNLWRHAAISETMQGAHVPNTHPSPNVEQLKGDLVGCFVLHVHKCLSSLCRHVSGCPGLITSAWGRASPMGHLCVSATLSGIGNGSPTSPMGSLRLLFARAARARAACMSVKLQSLMHQRHQPQAGTGNQSFFDAKQNQVQLAAHRAPRVQMTQKSFEWTFGTV